jgi:hypothetical protein
MANTVNYATQFERDLVQKYNRELLSSALTTNQVRFIGAKTIKLPFITVGGYKMHSRAGGFNAQDVSNDWMTKELGFDRDVEFFVDSMDVDESNYALTAANVTNTFLTEQAIPETDCYRFSKIYSDFDSLGGTVDNTAITKDNILGIWDGIAEQMTEDSVPEGRIIYATPAVMKAIKEATGLSRSLNVGNNGDTAINRVITALDNATIVEVPSIRLKSAYDFSNGFTPATGAKQINMMVVAPSAVIACDKHSYIRLWPEGTHTKGDGFLYQNRKYGDLWLIDNRIEGVYINADA